MLKLYSTGIEGALASDISKGYFLERVQSAAEVDPEMVRSCLRDFMQQLLTLEKDKVGVSKFKLRSFQKFI